MPDAIEKLAAIDAGGALASRISALREIAASVGDRARLTLDPTERHGFEYQSWFGFTLYGEGARGARGRGGLGSVNVCLNRSAISWFPDPPWLTQPPQSGGGFGPHVVSSRCWIHCRDKIDPRFWNRSTQPFCWGCKRSAKKGLPFPMSLNYLGCLWAAAGPKKVCQ